MMGKILGFALILLLPLCAAGQKSELGIAGGMKSDGGWTTSLAYYLKLGKIQLGPVVEMSQVNSKFVFQTFTTSSYIAVSPGVNVNIIFPFPKGYIYPGITGRYRIGSDGAFNYRGMDMGFHAGVVVKLIKSLSANAEAGFRAESIGVIDVADIKRGTTTSMVIPIIVGIRWGL